MRQLKFRAIHRILLQGLLNSAGQVGGYTLSELNKMLSIEKKVLFTEEEVAELNLRQEDGAMKWNRFKDGKEKGKEVDVEKDFEFSDDQADVIKGIIEKKDKEKAFTFSQMSPIIEIGEQLGLKFE